ncbi:MAG: phytoene desaturase family protein [Acidimicrobiales bacterium]
MAAEYDAVVVGAGPNGLAAATTLADAGATVVVLEAAATPGGGARSAELTLPGFVHDVCSAVHPLGCASPYLSSLPLARHGLEWVTSGVALAHPLDDGRAGLLLRSVEETASALGDPRGYPRLMEPLVSAWDALVNEVLRPPLRLPSHPLTLARFGARAVLPATYLARATLRSEAAAALFAGMAAHSFADLSHPVTAAAGLLLGAAGHAVGWPVARGGSQRLVDALVAHLEAGGGRVETGRPVTSLDDVPPARAVLFDTAPRHLARIAGDRLPDRYRRRLERYRHGPAAFKVDYALDGPVPWTADGCRRAGTVHLGGTLAEVAAAERAVAAGRVPERPFVLVAQQSVLDPSRAPEGRHTLWAYCHVPNGCTLDMTAPMEAQIERFAPGFGERVLARAVRSPADIEADNPNAVGGDIAGGDSDGLRLVFRPSVSANPYRTPAPGIFLCSASTSPGAGVHGMCGHWAAREALAWLGG